MILTEYLKFINELMQLMCLYEEFTPPLWQEEEPGEFYTTEGDEGYYYNLFDYSRQEYTSYLPVTMVESLSREREIFNRLDNLREREICTIKGTAYHFHESNVSEEEGLYNTYSTFGGAVYGDSLTQSHKASHLYHSAHYSSLHDEVNEYGFPVYLGDYLLSLGDTFSYIHGRERQRVSPLTGWLMGSSPISYVNKGGSSSLSANRVGLWHNYPLSSAISHNVSYFSLYPSDNKGTFVQSVFFRESMGYGNNQYNNYLSNGRDIIKNNILSMESEDYIASSALNSLITSPSIKYGDNNININVDFTANASISNDYDVEHFTALFADRLREELAACAEGVHLY